MSAVRIITAHLIHQVILFSYQYFPNSLSEKNFQKSQTFSEKPLDKTKKVCYTISVDRRGHAPDTQSRALSLSPVVFLSHRSLSKGLFAHFISFLYSIGLVVLPIIVRVFMVISFLTTGKRPVTAWREHIHADKAVGRLTARTDERLILSSSQAV